MCATQAEAEAAKEGGNLATSLQDLKAQQVCVTHWSVLGVEAVVPQHCNITSCALGCT